VGNHTSFKPDSLARELARRGLSIEAFATSAEVDRSTIERAMKGRALHATTFGKILTALGKVEPLPMPDGMVEESA
jgi:predicted transcriptional regulator